MDAKFFNSLTEGDFGNGIFLCQALTEGDFWIRTSGCHTVYCGQDGNIDYDNIQAVMEIADSQVAIANQDLPADTIWHYVRRQVSGCGLESPDGVPICVVDIDSNGDARAAAPNPPISLTAEQVAGGKIKLRWRYSSVNQAVAPTGFKVYMDSGSGFNFASPEATVSAPSSFSRSGGGEISPWTSDALSHGQTYKFCVRSYKTAGGETQNTNYVSIAADDQGPAAITDLRASWQEV